MKKLLSILLFACTLASCHQPDKPQQASHREGDIPILRADQLLFGTPTDQLEAKLMQEGEKYHCPPLFDIPVGDPQLMPMLLDFIQTPGFDLLYDSVRAHYADLSWLERDLTAALRRLRKAYGDNSAAPLECRKAIAHINGSMDYNWRCVAHNGVLLISIDQYVLSLMEPYGYFGQSQYIARMSSQEYLLTDCLSAIAQQVIPVNEMRQMLDHMIAEGKVLYMLDLACPKMDDRLKMRYTPEQMAWMQKNEKHVWAYLCQQKLLFESSDSKFRNFIDDAPHTNAFGNESAPRSAAYIGWQIVRQYVKRTGCSLQELLNETNSNTILTKSGYRP